jgi:methylenetetrahydrofolate--tRNA-(uracil-5-)-methyltransferase
LSDLLVIGGGLAGCEAAWQAAERGLSVLLYEMRPHTKTGAHTGDRLAELVCSNSLGSNQLNRASGLLKQELRSMGSMLIRCADQTSLPAGGALAVDRQAFAALVTAEIEQNPRIKVIRQEVVDIPAGLTILASGPLTSARLAEAIARITGAQQLYFYDAIAPIVSAETIDMSVAFRGSRYKKSEPGEGDYINCPMSEAEYSTLMDALLSAGRVDRRDFEKAIENGVTAGPGEYFEGCLPVEVLARRGRDTLAYGPLRPVGLTDPHRGYKPYAVVQLRQDNLAGTLYNMVGFQTNLACQEQRSVFRRIPGLHKAEFVRYGQMHRNTFINSPLLLKPTLQLRERSDLLFAGQIIGVEGYAGNIATGLLAGIHAARLAQGEDPHELPATTMTGALCHYIAHASPQQFQPMKANFGLLPSLEGQGRQKMSRDEKGIAYSRRALEDLQRYLGAENERL